MLEIDLNGVDRENISLDFDSAESDLMNLREGSEFYKEDSDTLLVNTFWAGNFPDWYEIKLSYGHSSQKIWDADRRDEFEVTPSKPELRLDVLNDGTEEYITRNQGILVDAGSSFDPDKTDLKYIWKYGATPQKADNSTAKFWSYDRAESIIEDGYSLRTKRDFDFLRYFVPEIDTKEVVSSGPYSPSDTIRIQVKTETYDFTKNTYDDAFELGLSIDSSEARVAEWKEDAVPHNASDVGEDPRFYTGIIEIPASELSRQEPTITVYNKDNRRKKTEVGFPEANTLVKDGRYWVEPSVRDQSYVIEKPRFDRVTVDSSEKRDEYRQQGYTVEEERTNPEYVLEKQVKVADAKYRTDTKNFSTKRLRDIFLSSEWYASGVHQKQVSRTEVETNWVDTIDGRADLRDSSLWNGELTGETRQVVKEPALYRTDRKYEYDKEVEKTGTRTVTKTRTVSVPNTGTRTVTRCHVRYACYKTTETYTYYTTETRHYRVTRTYTYTVTRTKTYWSPTKIDPDHRRTGESRRIKVKDAVYETQHEVERKNRYTETVQVYEASHETLVHPAKHGWEVTKTTEDRRYAHRQANSNENLRLGRSQTATSWLLSKQVGTERFETQTYSDKDNVVKTTIVVEGNIVQKYLNEDTGEQTKETINDHIKEFSYEGFKSRSELLNNTQRDSIGSSPCSGNSKCKI